MTKAVLHRVGSEPGAIPAADPAPRAKPQRAVSRLENGVHTGYSRTVWSGEDVYNIEEYLEYDPQGRILSSTTQQSMPDSASLSL